MRPTGTWKVQPFFKAGGGGPKGPDGEEEPSRLGDRIGGLGTFQSSGVSHQRVTNIVQSEVRVSRILAWGTKKETRDCKSLCYFEFPPMVLPPSSAEELSRSLRSLCSQEAGWLLNPILVTPGQGFTRVRTASSTGLLTQRNATEMRTRNWSIPIIRENKCSSILNYRKWGWDSTAERRRSVV